MTQREDDVHLLRAAVEAVPSGLLVVDDRGTILLVNREIERLFGYRRQDLIGRPIEILVPEAARASHPKHRSEYLERPGARRMDAGRDLSGRRSDGTQVPLEIGLTPVETERGTFVLASVVDVGARQRAEHRFRAAVESSPSGMIMTDAEGRIVLVNREAERIFGYDRRELLGQKVEVLIPVHLRYSHPGYRKQFGHVPRPRPMGRGQKLYGLRKDGVEVPVEIGLNPIETDEGAFVLSSIIDITARQALEDQLRQSQKMEVIGTLAGGVAHDFNNLLLAIVGYTQLAHRRASRDPELRADLDKVLAAAERGRQLVQRILAFSRKREAERTAIALDRPVREALQLLRASLPATVEMREHLDAEAPWVLADEIEIHQILMNLATNAAHAMGAEGGVLEVRLTPLVLDDAAAEARGLRPGLYARLAVSDDGPGMSPEVRERAFEPFFTTKPPGEGTGLGLSVIQGIVKRCEGAIDITSQPGQGTTVEIVLPAAQSAEPAPGAAGAGPPSQAGRRILLVDDEELLAELVRRQLELVGYRVRKHTSSPEALEEFRADPEAFDLVITDNTMPRMTGIVLAGELRKLRPDQRILMVSGIGERLEPDALREKGILLVLPKPHTFQELEEAIRRAFEATPP